MRDGVTAQGGDPGEWIRRHGVQVQRLATVEKEIAVRREHRSRAPAWDLAAASVIRPGHDPAVVSRAAQDRGGHADDLGLDR